MHFLYTSYWYRGERGYVSRWLLLLLLSSFTLGVFFTLPGRLAELDMTTERSEATASVFMTNLEWLGMKTMFSSCFDDDGLVVILTVDHCLSRVFEAGIS